MVQDEIHSCTSSEEKHQKIGISGPKCGSALFTQISWRDGNVMFQRGGDWGRWTSWRQLCLAERLSTMKMRRVVLFPRFLDTESFLGYLHSAYIFPCVRLSTHPACPWVHGSKASAAVLQLVSSSASLAASPLPLILLTSRFPSISVVFPFWCTWSRPWRIFLWKKTASFTHLVC